MLKIAIVDDELPDCSQFARWILSAKPGALIDIWHTREEATSAVQRETYDLVILDLNLNKDRHAGFAVINAIKSSRQVPVLVISGADHPELYKGVSMALDAWDYLPKPANEHVFIETFLAALRAPRRATTSASDLKLDPLQRDATMWKNQRVNLPLSAQRVLNVLIKKTGEANATATYEELYEAVKSGRSKMNITKNINIIRAEFRAIDPTFDCIETIPMRGYRWVNRDKS